MNGKSGNGAYHAETFWKSDDPCPRCGSDAMTSGGRYWCIDCDWSADRGSLIPDGGVKEDGDPDGSGVSQLIGCYEYRGDGEWFKIKRPTLDELECDVLAESMNYRNVPRKVRDIGYDSFDGQPLFIDPDTAETIEVGDA